MSYLPTVTDVATAIIVSKTFSDGSLVPDYPKTYSILDAFGSYDAITAFDWQTIKDKDNSRNDRIAAFKAYVESIEEISVEVSQTNDVYRDAVIDNQ